VCCSVLQRVAACCSVLQCVAVCCYVLQCSKPLSSRFGGDIRLFCTNIGICFRDIGVFCRHIGLFGGYIRPVCRDTWLFCRIFSQGNTCLLKEIWDMRVVGRDLGQRFCEKMQGAHDQLTNKCFSEMTWFVPTTYDHEHGRSWSYEMYTCGFIMNIINPHAYIHCMCSWISSIHMLTYNLHPNTLQHITYYTATHCNILFMNMINTHAYFHDVLCMLVNM